MLTVANILTRTCSGADTVRCHALVISFKFHKNPAKWEFTDLPRAILSSLK